MHPVHPGVPPPPRPKLATLTRKIKVLPADAKTTIADVAWGASNMPVSGIGDRAYSWADLNAMSEQPWWSAETVTRQAGAERGSTNAIPYARSIRHAAASRRIFWPSLGTNTLRYSRHRVTGGAR